jgi:SAM-dependent methyltransferase
MSDGADAGLVWQVIHGFGRYWALVAALELGVFEHLSPDHPTSLSDLASACAAAPDRLEVLLDALSSTGLVRRDDTGWWSTVTGDQLLRRSSPRSMADLVTLSPGWPENWPALAGTVRGASPPLSIDREPASFYAPLVRATFATQYAAARALATTLAAPAGDAAPRVLDLGAGGAPWSIALLEAWAGAGAVVNDLPGVLALAEEQATAHGVDLRCRFVAGDYLSIELDGNFDVVILGHVYRAEPPARASALIHRAASVLAPEGCVLLVDYLVDNDHRGPANALALGLTTMANTDGGRAYTRGEIEHALRDAGLSHIESVRPLPYAEVLVSRLAPDDRGAAASTRQEART